MLLLHALFRWRHASFSLFLLKLEENIHVTKHFLINPLFFILQGSFKRLKNKTETACINNYFHCETQRNLSEIVLLWQKVLFWEMIMCSVQFLDLTLPGVYENCITPGASNVDQRRPGLPKLLILKPQIQGSCTMVWLHVLNLKWIVSVKILSLVGGMD